MRPDVQAASDALDPGSRNRWDPPSSVASGCTCPVMADSVVAAAWRTSHNTYPQGVTVRCIPWRGT